ncbi:hypothetical protein BDV95DRAFT_561116 [Massariosphaeria phaeospora]|uniref:Uncharacterized protein n=1 Tax=Massariosphaeria phaeospora TaxID=100035 RepID=A0A7C8MEQ2_9PLEO|nr:hypothetical protein BDV95DRAFT_561116 [Massariosphaeria phaeospora]
MAREWHLMCAVSRPRAPRPTERIPMTTSISSQHNSHPETSHTLPPSFSCLVAQKTSESPLFTSDTRRLAQETAPLTTQNGFQAIPKEQRIGIIVGVTVVAVLSAIAVGMCIIDFKRRMRKKRAARLNGRSELDMLENEIRGGRTGHIRPQGTNHRGLWDSLRVVPTKEASRESRLGSSIPADTLQRNVATAASQRDASGVSAGSSTRTRHESDHEWILAYTPRERASIVSSEGSSGLSVTSKPTVKPFLGARTTGQLESEEGRRRDP